MLDRIFRLSENNTTVRTEILAGVTTFLTMAYIIVVQPAVLSGRMFGMQTGMDFGSVMMATCLSAALATAIMALYARYPIAQAPGMGENFFFVFSVLPAAAAAGFSNTWQVALGVVFISGVAFLILSLFGLREMIINAVSPSLKSGIAVGIGLFIAFIGLQNAGLIVKDPGTAVAMNTNFASPDLVVFFFGLLLTAILQARGVRGSILWGIVATTLFALGLRFVLMRSFGPDPLPQGLSSSGLFSRFTVTTDVISKPPAMAPTFLKMDLVHALTAPMLPFIIIFLFMDMFDTTGTVISVAQQAGFLKDNKLPRARQTLLSDAIGTVAGAAMGTSTVTSYIESSAGVQQGGRTGLTSLTTALLFVAAIFFSPVIVMIGSYASITAPALVIVGSMLIGNFRHIDWSDDSESIPAFLTLIGIPLSYSISNGIALGLISYPIVKLFSGKGKEVVWLIYVLAAALLAYFVFVGSDM